MKCCWKTENVQEIQRRWQIEFGIQPPTRLTISRVRDKFEMHGTVMNINKQSIGRKKTSTSKENINVVLQTFTQCPKQSLRKCFRETAIKKGIIHRMFKTNKRRPYIPKLKHAIVEDDPDRRFKFCERFHDTDNYGFSDIAVWSDKATFKLMEQPTGIAVSIGLMKIHKLLNINQ